MRLTITFFIALIFFASTGQAQETEKKTEFGLKTGLNVSFFSASINSEPSVKAGFHIGVYSRTAISDKMYFRPELYFSSQGQKDEWITPPNGPSLGSTTTTVNYLNVPLLFETNNKVSFQFGPQVGLLLSGREVGTINQQKVDDDLKESMKAADLSLVLGLGVNASEHLNLGVRFNIGVTPIFDEPQGAPGDFPKIQNRVLHLVAGFSF